MQDSEKYPCVDLTARAREEEELYSKNLQKAVLKQIKGNFSTRVGSVIKRQGSREEVQEAFRRLRQ